MHYCERCKKKWFDVVLGLGNICRQCYAKDAKRGPNMPYYFSKENKLDFGEVPAELEELTQLEEMVIARVHVSVNVFSVSKL